jgi:hypothetical protein
MKHSSLLRLSIAFTQEVTDLCQGFSKSLKEKKLTFQVQEQTLLFFLLYLANGTARFLNSHLS